VETKPKLEKPSKLCEFETSDNEPGRMMKKSSSHDVIKVEQAQEDEVLTPLGRGRNLLEAHYTCGKLKDKQAN